jgi:regulator of sirC expression with transglutaminase-like and TPR domain
MPPMTPEFCRRAAYDAFVAQLPELASIDGLTRAAIAISMHELSHVYLEDVEEQLNQIVRSVRLRVRQPGESAWLAHLHDELFEVRQFRGNTSDYYHPFNSYLPKVLETGQGLPIALTLIYKAVAAGIGLDVEGINAPGHFVARVRTTSGDMFVDPFFAGTLLTEEELGQRVRLAVGVELPADQLSFQPASHRQWLSRILNNLQAVFAHQDRPLDLAAMQELQAALLHAG